MLEAGAVKVHMVFLDLECSLFLSVTFSIDVTKENHVPGGQRWSRKCEAPCYIHTKGERQRQMYI